MKRKIIVSIFLKSIFLVFILTGVSHSYIINIDAEVSGWTKHNGLTNGRDARTTNFVAGTLESNGLIHTNFFVFNLSVIEGTVRSAVLLLQNPSNGFYSFRNDYFGLLNYSTYSITGIYGTYIDSSDLLPENWVYMYTGVALWSISYNGYPVSFGDVEVNETSNGTTVEIPFNSAGLDNLNSFVSSGASDPYYAIAGRLINPTASEIHVFAYTGNNLYSRVLSIEIEEPPVRIDGELTTDHYTNLQEAYDNASNGDTIRTQAGLLSENLFIDLNKTVYFEGGYDNNYINIVGTTRLDGTIVISNGEASMNNFTIE